METILQRLTDLDDVSGAILVGKDGLIVTGTLHSEEEARFVVTGLSNRQRHLVVVHSDRSDKKWKICS